MDNVLLAIGPFQFYATAPSFDMLRNTLEPRWSEQERVSRRPAGQFIGPSNETYDLNGVLFPDSWVEQQAGTSSRDMLDEMSASANNGDTYPLVGMYPSNQEGYALGLFYIRSLQNERTWYDANGAKKITFQITLRQYGDDLR